MLHAFIAPVIGVYKPGRKFWRKNTDGKAMILRRHVAALRAMQETGLVLASVPKFQLIGVSTCGKRQQLMAQANAKRGNLVFQSFANCLDCFLSHLRVTWAIGHNDAIKDKVISWRKEIPIPWYCDYSHIP